MVAASTALMLPGKRASAKLSPSAIGQSCEVQIASISAHTFRLSILPIEHGKASSVPSDGSLVRESWDSPITRLRGDWRPQAVSAGGVLVKASSSPLAFSIETTNGAKIQRITADEATGVVTFDTGASPLLGLGEGGPQFDRRGSKDEMISGQGGYKLATHGGRVPIPWLIATNGWAMFIHHPFGTFDFTGPESKFQPSSPDAAWPLDIFFVAATDPATIMSEYASLTGHAE